MAPAPTATLEGDHRRPWVTGCVGAGQLVVAVALANKKARIAWAVMHRQENYQARPGTSLPAELWSLPRAMTRDGTVGRSGTTEGSLAFRWDIVRSNDEASVRELHQGQAVGLGCINRHT